MTTIAYDHKAQQIAVDGRVSADCTILTDTDKKWRHDGADLWFFCGSTSDSQWFIDIHKSGKAVEGDIHPDCGALLVRDGKVYAAGIQNDGLPFLCESDFNRAIGSGEQWAIAAMDFGKTACEAVNYAATKNTHTGPCVAVYDIETARFIV